MGSGYRWSNYASVGRNRYWYKDSPHRLLYYSAGHSLLLIREEDYQAIDASFPSRSESTLFDSLLKRGIIRTDTQRHESLVALDNLFHSGRSIGSFGIMTTYDCNMHCGYCGQTHRKKDMGQRASDKVAQHIIASVEDNKLTDIELRWYGGEPLLNPRAIFDISRKIKKASQKMGFTFSSRMASNGTLLSSGLVRKLVRDANLTKLDITLDGFGTMHDLSRPLHSGKASYELIKAALRDIMELSQYLSRFEITVRVNITNRNLDSIEDLIADLSFLAHNKHFSIQFMPVYEWGVESDAYRPKKTEVDQAIVQYLKVALQTGITTELLPLQTLNAPCMASTVMSELISVEGNIYSCSEYPLTPDNHESHILGNIRKCRSLPRKLDELDQYQSSLSIEKCGLCPFFPVCGGGCPRKKLAHSFSCPSYKTTFTERCDLIAGKLGLDIVADVMEEKP